MFLKFSIISGRTLYQVRSPFLQEPCKGPVESTYDTVFVDFTHLTEVAANIFFPKVVVKDLCVKFVALRVFGIAILLKKSSIFANTVSILDLSLH